MQRPPAAPSPCSGLRLLLHLRLLHAATRLIVPAPRVRLAGSCRTWFGGRWGSMAAMRRLSCPQTPLGTGEFPAPRCRHRPEARGSPLHGSSFSLHAWTLACRILSGFSPPDRVGALGSDAAVSPVHCRSRPRSTAAETRKGPAVAIRSPAASPRPLHSLPFLIRQLLPAPYLDV